MIRKNNKVGFIVLAGLTATVIGASLLGAAVISAQGKRSLTTYRPQPVDRVLANPYMGFAPDAKGGPYALEHRLVYSNITWKELEPAKGVYDFDKFEQAIGLDRWAQQGKKLILRLVLDVPRKTSHMDIPEWLYTEIGKDGTWYDVEIGKGFSPNYMNPILIQRHKELVAKLGEHYNGDNRIAFVQLGSLGHWGEWHTWDGPGEVIPFPKSIVSDQYVEHYMTAFPDKMLLMRRPYAIVKENKLGLFNDMFGNPEHTTEGFEKWVKNGYTFWLTGEKIPPVPDFWVYAPSAGEFADSSQGDKYFRESTFASTLNQARNSHVSWLGPSVPMDKRYSTGVNANIDTFLKTIGYRFRVDTESHSPAIAPGSALPVQMLWVNEGVAPFYFHWPVELSLVDTEGKVALSATTDEDIRTWLPGNKKMVANLKIPPEFQEGEYTLCVSILDPATALPAIDLAMDGKRNDGRYTLGQVNVKK
ncbi:DUF4832 domain-containing protein [Gorillibacterium sp. sgz5001074]|uniref:DUF4832 domain-containing protein n=1 Tax=Gorillibacterium sp. sgz5001074 TaxID=3446695 RepID=UPI003F662B14